jgi:sec-independent protein translocase protein TatA
MGLDNPIHIAFLLILLLLVFGAKRLPEMGRSLGAGMRGFKDSLSGQDAQPAMSSHGQRTPAAGSSAPAPVLAPAVQPVLAPVEEPGTPFAA